MILYLAFRNADGILITRDTIGLFSTEKLAEAYISRKSMGWGVETPEESLRAAKRIGWCIEPTRVDALDVAK